MGKINLIFGGLILISTSAFAAECLPREAGPVKKIILRSTDASCEAAQDMAGTLRSVSLLFRRPTPALTMIMGPQEDNASYDEGHVIQIPAQFVHVGRYGGVTLGNIAQLDVIVIHEFGHAMLEQILRKEFAREFQGIYNFLDNVSDLKEAEALGAKIEKIEYPKDLNFSLFNSILTPYGELYADTVAVFYTKDPSALVRALYFDNMSRSEFNYIRYRDFNANFTSEDLAWMGDDHAKLAAVRSFIGHNLMPKNQLEAVRNLGILERAIVRSAHIDITKGASPSATDANNQLIELIKEEMQR